LKQFYVVNGAIYLISSYDFFVNRPSCFARNQQQLQWATFESSLHVPQIILLCVAPDYIAAHLLEALRSPTPITTKVRH